MTPTPSRTRLRPFVASELAQVMEGRARSTSEGNAPVGPEAMDPERLRKRLAASGNLVDGCIDLAIEVDGRLIGEAGARSPEGGFPPGVFEIGIVIYDPAERGRGVGRAAVRLLTTELFDRFGAHRVQASTDVHNVAMRRVLETLGYAFEGVMRGFMPDPGGAADYALYAVLETEWRALDSSRAG